MDILVADDDASVRALLHTILTRAKFGVLEAKDGLQAIEILNTRAVDLVLTDLRMPGAGGLEVLRHSRKKYPKIPVLVLAGQGSISDCVDSMRAGAFNFLSKPFHPKDLLDIVQQTLRAHGPRRVGPETAGNGGQPQVALIGSSAGVRNVIETVERVARTNSTVLITGESGTGKEVVARLLHGLSPRASAPLMAINCGAISPTLIESELFGHAKGSFTGASEQQPGKFLQASGGTLFLDEIAEIPLGLQVKFLRVLQERKVTPVGDTRTREVDVRIIAATNQDLEAMVQAGTFRADLYYRLDVLPIRLPALRERREDIPLLARHFLDSMNRRFDREVVLGPEALSLMKTYDWPGNVREMENLFERLVVLNQTGTVTLEELPIRMMSRADAKAAIAAAGFELGNKTTNLQSAVATFETSLIERALDSVGGNKTRAAELLGLSRTTLLDKLTRRRSKAA